MKSPLHFPLILSLLLLLLPLQIHPSSAQLSPSEKRILLQLKTLLEHPQVLQKWDNATDFCSLRHPTSSPVVACSGNHVTELAIVGGKPSPALSREFSTDALFTALTKLSSLRRLTLVGLGLGGGLSGKISRFSGLESLNASSNRLEGSIPQSIGRLKRLKSLVLRDNLLSGSVPDLKGMPQLEELDLGGNSLGPNFPSLGKNLSKIVLNNNSIRSPVPERRLKTMNSLRVLDLYSNHMVGPVPPSLFSLPALTYINLARNQLSGEIPAELVSCSRTLKFVDISNNLLVGELPGCLQTVPAGADHVTVISLWNCLGNGSSKYQHKLSFCVEQAIAVDPRKKKEEKRGEPGTVKLGVVVGVIAAAVAVVSGVGLLGIGVYKRVWGRKRDDRRSSSFAFDVNSTRHLDGGGNSRRPMRMVSMGLPPYNVFTPEEMEEATNHFDPSNLVGVGSSQQVYRGKLKDGTVVLVKCQTLLKQQQQQLKHYSLQHHIDAISRLRHRHLMSVIGHSIVAPSQEHHLPHTPTTLLLVLESVPGASLKDHLGDWRKRDVLKWPQRMGMAMGIAKGIQYLHAGGVTGNDIKLENVLLDDNLTPKLFNYNISLPSKIVSESPPNAQDHNISARVGEEDDIYQLGVILIEVIIGRPITSQAELQDFKLQVETCLAESPGKLRDLTDPCIRGTFAYESLKTTIQIALNCLSEERSKRPSIEDVLWHLQYSLQVQEGWGSSGNLSGNLVRKLSGNLGAKLS